jgi:hypothetical protein
MDDCPCCRKHSWKKVSLLLFSFIYFIRYGHTVVFAKPNILVFGGNTGTDPVNDVWTLNVDKAPFTWVKLDIEGGNFFYLD